MPTCRIERDLPVKEYDVVVAGGGLTGVCAAIAAAREGARTLLVEATGALGGMATQGMVPGWCGGSDGEKFIHSGLARYFMQHSSPEGDKHDYITSQPPIDIELLKRVCDEQVLASGAELLLQSMVTAVEKQGDRIDAIVIGNKAGLSAVKAKVFIDCTGDGDLATWAGAEFKQGDETGELQPVSLCYGISDIRTEYMKDEQVADWRRKCVDDDRYPLIRDTFFGFGADVSGNVRVTNGGHLWDVDNTSPEDITRAMVDGRQLVLQLHTALKEYFPKSYGDSYLTVTAPLLGARETRRIIGDHTLTLDEFLARKRFDDEIALNSFFIDIHPSLAQRQLEREGKWNWGDEKRSYHFKKGEFHGIPYRCLTPKGLSNVLVAGRSISADRPVNSAIRVMPPCMSMGEAAGLAAAQAAQTPDNDVHTVNVTDVQNKLRKAGGFLPERQDAELPTPTQ